MAVAAIKARRVMALAHTHRPPHTRTSRCVTAIGAGDMRSICSLSRDIGSSVMRRSAIENGRFEKVCALLPIA